MFQAVKKDSPSDRTIELDSDEDTDFINTAHAITSNAQCEYSSIFVLGTEGCNNLDLPRIPRMPGSLVPLELMPVCMRRTSLTTDKLGYILNNRQAWKSSMDDGSMEHSPVLKTESPDNPINSKRSRNSKKNREEITTETSQLSTCMNFHLRFYLVASYQRQKI
jgi:hypothetical protein